GDGDRNRFRIEAAPRRRDYRRPDLQPDADALYHARDLSVSRSSCDSAGGKAIPGSGCRRVAGMKIVATNYANKAADDADCTDERTDQRDPCHPRLGLLLLFLAFFHGCTVGPNYKVPSAPVSAAFKESKDWKQAEPQDTELRGNWWELFSDPEL